MEHTRRSFLRFGGLAVGAAGAVALAPSAIAAMTPTVFRIDRSLRDIITSNLINCDPSIHYQRYALHGSDITTLVDLNMAVAAEAPEIIRVDRMMSGPEDVINGKPVFSRTRMFKCEYALQLTQDIKSICGLDAEEELRYLISAELAYEFKRVARTSAQHGLVICPYVPALMVRAIDPDTFAPKIGFKTRYGLMRA